MERLFIKVSNAVSAHCYSILRFEPYTSCAFGCRYCYARWYRSEGPPKPAYDMLEDLKRFLKAAGRAPTKLMPVRIATLVDPLQLGERDEILLRALELLRKHEHPVIFNTKGVARKPLAELFGEMASEGLLVFQISISTLDERAARLLEPGSPSPRERIEGAAMLSELGVPVVLRISPLIPEIAQRELEGLVGAALEARAKHVIVEAIRLPPDEFRTLYEALGLPLPRLESYGIKEEGLARHLLEEKLPVYEELRRRLEARGITFATCKEGLFDLHTSEDCCGMYLLRKGSFKRRITLFELYKLIRARGISPSLLPEAFRNLKALGDYIRSEDLQALPRPVRKPLLNHERRLQKIISDPSLLRKLSPLFDA